MPLTESLVLESSAVCKGANRDLMMITFETFKYLFALSLLMHILNSHNTVCSRLVNKCLVIRRSNERSELRIPLITHCSCGCGEHSTERREKGNIRHHLKAVCPIES